MDAWTLMSRWNLQPEAPLPLFALRQQASPSLPQPPSLTPSSVSVPSRWSVNLSTAPWKRSLLITWTLAETCWTLSLTDLAAAGETVSRTGTVSVTPLVRTPAQLWGGHKQQEMEISVEDDGRSSSPSFEYKAAHQAVRDRWKETDDTMCRHSMSFHLHHTLRSEFFASYLYLVEKIPLGKKKGHTQVQPPHQCRSREVRIYNLFLTLDSIKSRAKLTMHAAGFACFGWVQITSRCSRRFKTCSTANFTLLISSVKVTHSSWANTLRKLLHYL